MNLDFAKVYAFVLVPVLVSIVLFLIFRDSEHLPETASVRISDQEWTVEVAKTPEARARGLSDRAALCPGCAMIFLFEDAMPRGFWMKGMRFPLDIAWVRDGKIVHIERNVAEDFSGTLVPEESADTVIEVNAGALDGILVGNRISFPNR